jgi:hypothetical protein
MPHLHDFAVEERCEAIKAAADEAVAKIMQQLKMQLLQLPKKVCGLCGLLHLAERNADQLGHAAEPSPSSTQLCCWLAAVTRAQTNQPTFH